jgi:KTSC domain-containing protein
MIRLIIAIAVALFSFGASAESVVVKYRGAVDLAPFVCKTVGQSSFVRRVCYDSPHQYMLIQLNSAYYHYCGIDDATVSGLLAANSVGGFYNARIKGRFDCRVTPPPSYQ